MGRCNFPPALTQATEVPMAPADPVPTLNHAPNPDAPTQQSTTKLRSIRIRPADRRYFIGGSDARIIMGNDEAAPPPALAGEARRSRARGSLKQSRRPAWPRDRGPE